MSIDRSPITASPNVGQNFNKPHTPAVIGLAAVAFLSGCAPNQSPSNIPKSAPASITMEGSANPDRQALLAHNVPLVEGNKCLTSPMPVLYEEMISIQGTDGSTILTGSLQYKGSKDAICNGLRFGRFDPQRNRPEGAPKNTTFYRVDMDTIHSDGVVDHLEQKMPDFDDPDATRDPDWQAWTNGSATRRYKLEKPEIKDSPVANICVTALTDKVASGGLTRCLPPIDILDTGQVVRKSDGTSVFIS